MFSVDLLLAPFALVASLYSSTKSYLLGGVGSAQRELRRRLDRSRSSLEPPAQTRDDLLVLMRHADNFAEFTKIVRSIDIIDKVPPFHSVFYPFTLSSLSSLTFAS